MTESSGIVAPAASLTRALPYACIDVFIILGLILLNALLRHERNRSGISKKFALEQAAAQGDRGAIAAVTLAGELTRLLSTVQTGITLITLAQGAFGESAFTELLEHWLTQWTWAPYAKQASDSDRRAIIGMLSLIFGELVPKRIGLLFPEIIARWSARSHAVAVAGGKTAGAPACRDYRCLARRCWGGTRQTNLR
ncbi:MAG: CNNM domain-containing protein [Burkholderiales bacterium]